MISDEDLVFADDDLTWNVVGDSMGVEEPAYQTRGKKSSSVGSSSVRPPKGKSKQVDTGNSVKDSSFRLRDEDEDEYQSEGDDEEEEYIDDGEQFDDGEEEDFEFDENED